MRAADRSGASRTHGGRSEDRSGPAGAGSGVGARRQLHQVEQVEVSIPGATSATKPGSAGLKGDFPAAAQAESVPAAGSCLERQNRKRKT